MQPHIVLDGGFVVDLPLPSALELFTPEGERRWVVGWDPSYPAGKPAEPVAGTVFVTGATTWVVLERSHDTMRYARVATGRTAGTVAVTCRPSDRPGTTAVRVRYELTALGPQGAADVAELNADYDGFLAGWRRAIGELLRSERSPAPTP